MRARIRRPLTLLVVAVVAVGSLSTIAGAAPSRLRADAEPVALHVRGSSAPARPGSTPPIPMRNGGLAGAGTTAIADAGVDAAPAVPRPLAPVSTTHFDAIPQQNGFYPADPTGAIGVSNIVVAVNTSVAVYGRDGSVRLPPTSLDGLTPGIAGERFDPKVVYDQYTETFVLAWLIRDEPDQASWVVVTTIPDATAASMSTWCGAQLHGDGVDANGPQWADYPTLGYDANSVAIATNAFNFQQRRGFAYSQIFYIANDELFSPTCDGTVALTVFAQSATRDPDGTKAFTLQPAQTEGASNGDQFFLSYDESGPAVVVWRLRETSTGLALRRRALRVSRAQISPYGTQRGGSYRDDDSWWDPGDLRLVNAFYDADLDRVYAAHVIFRDLRPDRVTGGYPEAAIRWYEVHPTRKLRASRVTRVGIVGTPETDAGWPVVATDAAGNLFVTYNRASKPRGEYLSAWAAEIVPGATRARLTLLTAGTSRMEALPGVERWGDFNAINRDPVDGSYVAMINEYARSDGTGPTTRDWQETFDLVHHG
jgi:hypothetical protein